LLCGPAATLLRAIEQGESFATDADTERLITELHGLGLIEQVDF
jgi:hypothetical protein